MSYPSSRSLILLSASLSACHDTPVTPDDTSSGDSSSTSSSSTGDPTTGDLPTSTSSTSTGDATTSDSTGPGLGCPGFLCGALLTCCAADDNCIADGCVPGCADDLRCGEDLELCCAAGEVCLGHACVLAGGACTRDAGCAPGESCDEVAGVCLPAQDPPACAPKHDDLALTLEWSFTDDEVIAMPVVVDVTGDGKPEVIVNTTRMNGIDDIVTGELVCLDGATGQLIWRIPHNPIMGQFGAFGRSTIGAGDVSGDGVADIVYAGRLVDVVEVTTTIHAVDGAGNFLWTARNPDDTPVDLTIVSGAPALANLDDDPMAEIAFGAAIFDHDGRLLWNQDGHGGLIGTPHDKGQPSKYFYHGGLPVFADLTGDAYPELVTGREAWTIAWTDSNPPTAALTQLWKATSGWAGDGWPSVADLDLNGTPEVVLVAWPELKILDGATGELWCGVDPTGVLCAGDDTLRTPPLELFVGGVGGPAAIADFDGDGRPEIGLTTGSKLHVIDLNRTGESIVKPPNAPNPAPGALYTRWSSPVQDMTAGATGASAFDMNADGAVELFFNDECMLRIFDGATGEVLLELANSTAAIHEYPVVADVDDDGRSELLVVANLSNPDLVQKCAGDHAGWTPHKGIYLYRPSADEWTTTGKQWTQHSYHVTNADPAGNVPMVESDNWTDPALNDYRTAPHGDLVVASGAPDLTVSLAIVQDQCSDTLVLQAHVVNQGELTVPAGVAVTFHAGTTPTDPELATVPTAAVLVPGGFTIVETVVPAPPAGELANFLVVVDPDGESDECVESNNSAFALKAGCP